MAGLDEGFETISLDEADEDVDASFPEERRCSSSRHPVKDVIPPALPPRDRRVVREKDDVDEEVAWRVDHNEFTDDQRERMKEFVFDDDDVPVGFDFVAKIGFPTVKGDGFEKIHVSYPVVVQTNMKVYSNASPLKKDGRWTWMFDTRYSEVRKFHGVLQTVTSEPLPPLPPKDRFGRLKEEVAEIRGRAFSRVFDAISKDRDLLQKEVVVRFFWPRESLVSYRPKLENFYVAEGSNVREIMKKNAEAVMKRSIAKSSLKLVGHPLPMIGGVVEGGFEYKDTQQTGRAAAVGGGAVAGGVMGHAVGLTVGSMIVPSVGTVVGGFVGGFIGSSAGTIAARRVVRKKEQEGDIPDLPFDSAGSPKRERAARSESSELLPLSRESKVPPPLPPGRRATVMGAVTPKTSEEETVESPSTVVTERSPEQVDPVEGEADVSGDLVDESGFSPPQDAGVDVQHSIDQEHVAEDEVDVHEDLSIESSSNHHADPSE